VIFDIENSKLNINFLQQILKSLTSNLMNR